MSEERIRISFPVKWIIVLAAPLFGLGALQVHSAGAQADVVERAILIHGQEKHEDAASATDVQRMKYVQDTLNGEVTELKAMVSSLAEMHQELIIELRTRR